MRIQFMLVCFLVLSAIYSCGQSKKLEDSKEIEQGLKFYIEKEVSNYDDENEKQVIQLWKDYLLKGEFKSENSPYWSYENMTVPDEYLWAVDIPTLQNRGYIEQCKIIGVFLTETGYYSLKSAFSHLDAEGEIHLDAMVSVYAKKINDKFLLVNSAEYHKSILKKYSVGNIDYYVHPTHKFDPKKAEKMNEFNQFLSKEFDVAPLHFDYFVANNARDIVDIWGYEYMTRMYIPIQTGGVASIHNRIIYSGNNSEYYPHELVHLYTYSLVPKDYHFWFGEGIATFYGGSTQKPLIWHLQKLKVFLTENPDFDLSDIESLPMDIPNGEHQTAFRYVIGGFLAQMIYEKEGVSGLIDLLHTENTKESFFTTLEEKLGIQKEGFDSFIKNKVQKLEWP